MSVSIVIPAHNEQDTIAEIVRVAVRAGFVDVIVVDDGSGDNTATVARSAGARVVRLDVNQGKGEAMRIGLEEVSPYVGVVLFWDADLEGTTVADLEAVYKPVEDDQQDMVIGVLATAGQRLAPGMSGLRALPTRLARQFFATLKTSGIAAATVRFSVERRLNEWFDLNNEGCRRTDSRWGDYALTGLRKRSIWLPHHIRHRTKLQKRGLWRGLIAWLRMWWEIIWGY